MYVSRRMSGKFEEEDGPVWDETDGVAGPLAPAGGRLGHWELKPVDPAFHDDEPGAPSPRVKESYLGSYRARGSRGADASPFEEADASPPDPLCRWRRVTRGASCRRRGGRGDRFCWRRWVRSDRPRLAGEPGKPMPPLIAVRRLLPRPSFQRGASERRLHLFGTDGNLRRRWTREGCDFSVSVRSRSPLAKRGAELKCPGDAAPSSEQESNRSEPTEGSTAFRSTLDQSAFRSTDRSCPVGVFSGESGVGAESASHETLALARAIRALVSPVAARWRIAARSAREPLTHVAYGPCGHRDACVECVARLLRDGGPPLRHLSGPVREGLRHQAHGRVHGDDRRRRLRAAAQEGQGQAAAPRR